MEAWIKLPTSYPSTKMPILCTLQSTLCFYVEAGLLKGTYGTTTLSGSSVLAEEYWHHVAYRYDVQSKWITMYAQLNRFIMRPFFN